MNSIILILRICISLFYFGLSVKMFVIRHAYAAGWAAVVIGLIVLFPVLRLIYRRQRIVRAAAITKSFSTERILTWIRKVIALLFCYTVVGAFQREQYLTGAMITFICLLLLSPLGAFLFGPVGLSTRGQRPDWRAPVILIARNAGWVLYTAGVFAFVSKKGYDVNQVITLLVTGLVLLFIRPIILLLAPFDYVTVPATDLPVPVEEPQLPDIPATDDRKMEVFATIVPATQPRNQALQELKTTYMNLALLPPQRRGYAFQDFLNALFSAHDIVARGAFRLTGEEIDGSFDIGPQTYLLEAKWQANPTSQSDLLIFNSKVEGKSTWARGIFISHAGFGADGLKAFAHGKRTSIIGMNGDDIQLILDGHIPLKEAIKRKAMKAVESNDFFVPLVELI